MQIQVDGWTFSLDGKQLLTIHGAGKTTTHKHNGMSPDELKGFALGWAASQHHMTRDLDLGSAPFPTFS